MKKIFYRVEKSDTLCALEDNFKIPVSRIIFDNNLQGEISEGDLLVLNILDYDFYTVSPCDNENFITEKFCMDEGEVRTLNKIEYVYPFQKIWVKKKLL